MNLPPVSDTSAMQNRVIPTEPASAKNPVEPTKNSKTNNKATTPSREQPIEQSSSTYATSQQLQEKKLGVNPNNLV